MSRGLNLRISRRRSRQAALLHTATGQGNQRANPALLQLLGPAGMKAMAHSQRTFRDVLHAQEESLRSARETLSREGIRVAQALEGIGAELARACSLVLSNIGESARREHRERGGSRHHQGEGSSRAKPRRPRAVAAYPATPLRAPHIRHTCPDPSTQAPCDQCPRVGCARTGFKIRL